MIATRPTASRGSQCSAKIRDTPVSTPAAIASIAPPGISSSAAWKISRTPTGSSGTDASASAAPSRIAVCASWPQACATLGIVDVYGAPVRSAIGSASMSARSAIRRPVLGAEVADQPGAAGQHLRVEPGVGQPLGDELRGGELLAAQLGVAVDVAAPVDQIVVVCGQPGFGGVGEAHARPHWPMVATRAHGFAAHAPLLPGCGRQHPVPFGGRLRQAHDGARQHDGAVDDRAVAAGTRGSGGEAGW